MTTRILIFFAGALWVTAGFSQRSFRKGYIITTSMDTVFGFVADQHSANASGACVFKKRADNTNTTYYPGSLFGYGFDDDKFYQSKRVLVNEPLFQPAFLEVVVKGRVSLYRLGQNYFIEKDTSGLQSLKNESKSLVIDGDKYQKNTNQHIGVINMLMYDCPELLRRIRTTKLIRKSLTKLVEQYHQCKGERSITYLARKPWARVSVGVIAGSNRSQLRFSSYPGFEHLAGNFEVATSPLAGLLLDFSSPRLSERLSVYGEITFLHSQYYRYSVDRLPTSTRINYVAFDLPQFKVPVGLRYHFRGETFKPYLSLGVSSTFHPKGKSTWIQEVEANSIVRRSENAALKARDTQVGWWANFGMLKPIHRKFALFFEARYERTNGIAPGSVDTRSLSSNISNIQILCGARVN